MPEPSQGHHFFYHDSFYIEKTSARRVVGAKYIEYIYYRSEKK